MRPGSDYQRVGIDIGHEPGGKFPDRYRGATHKNSVPVMVMTVPPLEARVGGRHGVTPKTELGRKICKRGCNRSACRRERIAALIVAVPGCHEIAANSRFMMM